MSSYALTIPHPTPSVFLVTNAKDVRAFNKRMDIGKHPSRPQWKDLAGARGLTWTMEIEGTPCWVIGLDPKELDHFEAITTLVHEAVHVWQGWRKYIAEDEPSSEFEAYSIESITAALLSEYGKKVNT